MVRAGTDSINHSGDTAHHQETIVLQNYLLNRAPKSMLSGWDSLHFAVSSCQFEISKMLIESGIDFKAKTIEGYSAKEIAENMLGAGSIDVLEYIIMLLKNLDHMV